MAKPAKKKRPAPKKARPRAKAKHAGGRPRRIRRLKEFAAVGDPPADPLAATEWTYQLLMVGLNCIRTDPDITDRERVRELRTTAKAAKDLIPAARIAQAERVIREDAARMHQGEPEAQELTDVPASSLPGGSLATTARRIRERKR